MNEEQQGFSPAPQPGAEHAMNGSPTSGPTRQHARRQGQARMSALTRVVGAASVLGAVAIAVSLPQSTSANTAAASPATTSLTSASSGDDNSSSDDNSGTASSSTAGSSSQLQPSAAPTTTTTPPAATSGGS
jgi:hypothetical protein